MVEFLSESMEDYLETILILIREHSVARSKDIAARLKVRRSSVTGMLQTLRDRGYLNYERYGYVTLTPEGAVIAGRVLRRHEALRDFMVNVLSIDPEEADVAACRMEHGVSKHIVDRLIEFGEFVKTCPRAGEKWVYGFGYHCGEAAGSPEVCERCIEKCLDEVRRSNLKGEDGTMSVSLKELEPGERGRIEKVSGEGPVRQRMIDMGATSGTIVEVVRIAPLGDPIDVRIKGYHLSLRREEAADIIVKRFDG